MWEQIAVDLRDKLLFTLILMKRQMWGKGWKKLRKRRKNMVHWETGLKVAVFTASFLLPFYWFYPWHIKFCMLVLESKWLKSEFTKSLQVNYTKRNVQQYRKVRRKISPSYAVLMQEEYSAYDSNMVKLLLNSWVCVFKDVFWCH